MIWFQLSSLIRSRLLSKHRFVYCLSIDFVYCLSINFVYYLSIDFVYCLSICSVSIIYTTSILIMNIQRRKKSKEIENIEVNFRWLQLFDTIKHCSWYFWNKSFLKMSINDREKILHNYSQTFLSDCFRRRLVSKTRKKQILKASEIFLITTRKSKVYRWNSFWICKLSVERSYFFRFDVFYEQRIFESKNFEDEKF